MTPAALATIDKSEDVLPPARRALVDHQANIASAKADLERATKPTVRLREQLRVSNERLAAAEADLAAVDAEHAASIRDQARSGVEIMPTTSPASANEEAALERARRTVNAIRAALSECESDLREAATALRNAEAQLDPLLLAVVLEQFGEGLQTRQRTFAEFSAAENQMRGLLDATAGRGRALLEKDPDQGRAWLQACERMTVAHGKLPTDVGDFRHASASWTATLIRLSTEARAR